jgi:hypothetical protein
MYSVAASTEEDVTRVQVNFLELREITIYMNKK